MGNGIFSFISRYVFASSVGALGVISLALGYADQAKVIATQFNPVALQALGAAFVVTFIFMVLMKMDKEHREHLSPPNEACVEVATGIERNSTPLAPDAKAAGFLLQGPLPPEITKGRIFLTSHNDPLELMALCNGKTDVQAHRAIEGYLGKWIPYEGKVRNVYRFKDSSVTVRFETEGIKSIKAVFENNPELADVLHIGDVIHVVGKLAEIDSMTIALAEAEVVTR